MANGGVAGWVATWNAEKVLAGLLAILTLLVTLRRGMNDFWEPWRRNRWCTFRRHWCQGNPEQPWPVPEKHRDWARWGAEKKMFLLTEYNTGELEIWLPGVDHPVVHVI